jgi:O-antigen/teichoic acid export membrane protein
MGVEAYGLVGIYALFQSWFQLLDVGLSPTMMRETARFLGGGTDAINLRRLVRAMEGFFIGVGLIGCLAMMLGSNIIVSRWLKVQHLSLAEVRQAVMLMAVIVTLRWVSELYRGMITGFERLVWLNAFNIGIATMRYISVILVFKFLGTRPVDFFGYQLVVGIIELVLLVIQTYRLLPSVAVGAMRPWDWAPLWVNFKFSLVIAFTGSVWVFVTQTDKLILSKLLSLSEYAYFTIAVMAAGGIMVVFTPISAALLPRMTRLSAEGDDSGLITLYRHATQAVAVVTVPAVLVLALFPEHVILAWTGNAVIAHQAAPVLRLYAFGNGFMVLAAFPYFLQFAKGDLKLHLIGNALFVTLLVPALVWATHNHGAIGAGWVWLGSNVALFSFWTPIVHRKFYKNLHTKWLLKDIIFTVIPPLLLGEILLSRVNWPEGRWASCSLALLLGFSLLIVAMASTSWVRSFIKSKIYMQLGKNIS